MSQPPFSIGDRVVERPQHGRPMVAKPGTKSFDQVCSYLREIRTGEVTGIEERRIKNGSKYLYVEVRWDGFRSPSWHARQRLQRVKYAQPAPVNTLSADHSEQQ